MRVREDPAVGAVAALRDVSGGVLNDGAVTAAPKAKLRGVLRLEPDVVDQHGDSHEYRSGFALCEVQVLIAENRWATAYQAKVDLRPLPGTDEWEGDIEFLLPVVDPPRPVRLACRAWMKTDRKTVEVRETTIADVALGTE